MMNFGDEEMVDSEEKNAVTFDKRAGWIGQHKRELLMEYLTRRLNSKDVLVVEHRRVSQVVLMAYKA